MKKIIILSAFAIAALAACTKDELVKPEVSGEFTRGFATIDARFDDTKLSLNGTNFVWTLGDQVRGRCDGVAWANDEIWVDGRDYNLFTLGADGKFTGEFFYGGDQYSPNKSSYFFAAKSGKFTKAASSSMYTFPFAKTQTGKLEDLGNYTISYAKGVNNNTRKDVMDRGDGTYNITLKFNPFFALVKFNVPENLGITKIELEGHELGGELNLSAATVNYVWKDALPWGTSKFANFTANSAFDKITVYRGGDVISGDVYVVVSPNTVDPNMINKDEMQGEYVNDTETLSVTLYPTSGMPKTFSHKLNYHMVIGGLKDLGTIPANTKFEEAPTTNYAKFTVPGDTYYIEASEVYDWSATKDECLEMCLYADAGKKKNGSWFYGSLTAFIGEFTPFTDGGNYLEYYSADTYLQGGMNINKWGNMIETFKHKITAIDLNLCTISATCSWNVWDCEDEFVNNRTIDQRHIETVTGEFVDYHFTLAE